MGVGAPGAPSTSLRGGSSRASARPKGRSASSRDTIPAAGTCRRSRSIACSTARTRCSNTSTWASPGRRSTTCSPFAPARRCTHTCSRPSRRSIDRGFQRKDPVFEHLYLGQPWTEIDYLLSICTCAAMYAQLKQTFPEVVAVNAIYTHGLVVIVSTKVRVGGFAKAVGLRVFSTPHGLGHAKVVIVVDENVDPFDMKQV